MLQLKTFGGLWLTGGDPRLEGREGLRRQLLLLALVAESGERGISRDRAIAFFWPEGDEERGRRSLNQMRYTLRRELGVDPLIGTRTLRVDPASLSSDVAEFAAAIAAGDADRAAALYAGPFLDGVFAEGSAELEAMIEERRAALRRALEGGLGGAARAAEGRGDWDAAVGYWRRLVGLDPLSTSFAIGLISALAESDDASGALVAAAAHEAVVRKELETAPDARVTALVTEIRRSTRAIRRDTPAAAAVPDANWRVTGPAPAAGESSASSAGTSGSAPRRWRRWAIGLAAGVGLVAGSIAGALRFAPATSAAVLTLLRRPAARLVPNRIAVAPLLNQTGDSTLDALGEMAADWIAQGLAETGAFDVVDPRTALVTAKVVAKIPGILRRGDRAVALARETGAALSVGGSYYKDGDSLRAAVRVVGTGSGQVLRLVTPVAGVARDPGALVTSLARLTVAAVAATLDTTSAGLAATLSPPPSYEAYAETSRAWESYYRGDSADAFRRARHAIALDSGYAPPLLMQAYMLASYDRWEEADSTLKRVGALRLRLTPVETAAFHALEADVAGDLGARLIAAREMMRLAPASTEAATLVAGSALRLGRNREVLSALGRVDPDRGLLLFLPSYWSMSAQALHNLGRYREAAASARRGLRQSPADWGLWRALVGALAAEGDYDETLKATRERVPGDPFPAYNAAWFASIAAGEFRGHDHERLAVRLLDSLADHPFPHSTDSGQALYDRVLRGEILYQAGRWAAADSALRPLESHFKDEVWHAGRLATIAARLGRHAEAERMSAELRDRPTGYLHGRQTFWRAHIATALGQREAAVLLLRDAYAQGYPMNDDYYVVPHADRDFAELLHDPAFLGVMRRE